MLFQEPSTLLCKYTQKGCTDKGGTNIEDLQFIIEEDPFEKGSLLKLLP